MYDDPLSNLPPETQQRVQDALRSFANGAFQDMSPVFVTQFTDAPNQQTHSYTNQAWAHWDYDADEWELFDTVDWETARRKYWLPNGVGTLVYLLLVGILALLFASSAFMRVLIPAMALLVVLFLLFGLRLYPYSEAKKRYQARQNQAQPHRVTFSEQGVWEAGTYFPLNEIFLHLRKVKLTAQPCVLHFSREKERPGGATNTDLDTLRVLVPRGREEEAAQLMQRYQDEVINAGKKTYNPREPD